VRQGLACGAAAYLAKPFDPRDLVATVRRLTRRSEAGVTGG
jgi:DNA-binding response OmpR family regulator